MEAQPVLVDGGACVTPVEHRALERRLGLGIGNVRAGRLIGELREAGELAPPALGHARAQIRAEIAEEEERLGRGPFLAHEEEGQGGREEEHRGGRAHRIGGGERGDPLAEGAIADLIVILEEAHEGGGR